MTRFYTPTRANHNNVVLRVTTMPPFGKSLSGKKMSAGSSPGDH
jgi:hypothetical protein